MCLTPCQNSGKSTHVLHRSHRVWLREVVAEIMKRSEGNECCKVWKHPTISEYSTTKIPPNCIISTFDCFLAPATPEDVVGTFFRILAFSVCHSHPPVWR